MIKSEIVNELTQLIEFCFPYTLPHKMIHEDFKFKAENIEFGVLTKAYLSVTGKIIVVVREDGVQKNIGITRQRAENIINRLKRCKQYIEFEIAAYPHFKREMTFEEALNRDISTYANALGAPSYRGEDPFDRWMRTHK